MSVTTRSVSTRSPSPMSTVQHFEEIDLDSKGKSLASVEHYLKTQAELEKDKITLENSWKSCCFNLHKPSVLYFTQLGAVSSVIVFSGIMLATGGSVSLYSSLLSLGVGYLLPSPKLSDLEK